MTSKRSSSTSPARIVSPRSHGSAVLRAASRRRVFAAAEAGLGALVVLVVPALSVATSVLPRLPPVSFLHDEAAVGETVDAHPLRDVSGHPVHAERRQAARVRVGG